MARQYSRCCKKYLPAEISRISKGGGVQVGAAPEVKMVFEEGEVSPPPQDPGPAISHGSLKLNHFGSYFAATAAGLEKALTGQSFMLLLL